MRDLVVSRLHLLAGAFARLALLPVPQNRDQASNISICAHVAVARCTRQPKCCCCNTPDSPVGVRNFEGCAHHYIESLEAAVWQGYSSTFSFCCPAKACITGARSVLDHD
mmetsp:Transcript_160560/g.490812  ORF Transcript_160560/g.490812 Transcript_160560/m.490812 type:complete len:110 (-) Transcript_160560:25-354(-)